MIYQSEAVDLSPFSPDGDAGHCRNSKLEALRLVICLPMNLGHVYRAANELLLEECLSRRWRWRDSLAAEPWDAFGASTNGPGRPMVCGCPEKEDLTSSMHTLSIGIGNVRARGLRFRPFSENPAFFGPVDSGLVLHPSCGFVFERRFPPREFRG